MREALLRDRVPQRADNVILPKHILEGLGAILSGENLITHAPKHRELAAFVIAEFSNSPILRAGAAGSGAGGRLKSKSLDPLGLPG